MKPMVGTPQPVIAVSRPPQPLPHDRHYGEVIVGLVGETVSVNRPPPFINRGDWWSVGRSKAWPHQWIFQGWNKESTLAIVEPNGFKFPSFPSAMVIPGSPQPGQNPGPVGVTIIAPPRGTWGAKSTITPPIGINPGYLKLM